MKKLILLIVTLLSLTFNLHAQDERKIKENIAAYIMYSNSKCSITSLTIISKDYITERLLKEVIVKKLNAVADDWMLDMAESRQQLGRLEKAKNDQPERWKTDKKFKDGLIKLQGNLNTDLKKETETYNELVREADSMSKLLPTADDNVKNNLRYLVSYTLHLYANDCAGALYGNV